MAHYAFLDENNIVTEVIVGKNEGEDGKTGEEWEAHYSAFRGQVCKKTSYNGNIRKNYAGIRFKYDADLDAFIPPKPFASWLLNEETAQWEAPVPIPTEGMWSWDEATTSWVEIEITSPGS
jgi:hypothetical protein